ncbi:MAG: hypothetical protein AUK35_07560 [Zetaproteobacteria bacterium CG2_30_46_52]|nr:MAG: hypothetical protein AUK35_07560 [Zetaproteobacteria bacterium CG2_30_46_52]
MSELQWQSAIWIGPVYIGLSGIGFAIFHSLAATHRCKAMFYAMGMQVHHYRLLYSVLGLLTTLGWLWFIYSLENTQLYATSGFTFWLLIAAQLLGAVIAFAALLPIDGAVFLGLKKSEFSPDPFVVSGIYNYLRHPMYAGLMLFLLASPEQSYNGLAFTLVVSAYMVYGSKLEEKRLLAEHPDYLQYQQEVPAFVPTLKSLKKR